MVVEKPLLEDAVDSATPSGVVVETCAPSVDEARVVSANEPGAEVAKVEADESLAAKAMNVSREEPVAVVTTEAPAAVVVDEGSATPAGEAERGAHVWR